MGSSDRSLSSGISIPQWMKGRMGDSTASYYTFGCDVQEPFSPPSNDDNFFYLRYPKVSSQKQQQQPGYSVLKSEIRRQPEPLIVRPQPSSPPNKPKDFSQHPLPCQQFIPNAPERKAIPMALPDKPRMVKSTGTDDGFKGDGAACGISVMEMAHQMVAGKFMVRDEPAASSEGFDFNRRRGSKSLPTSPLQTPLPSPDSSPAIPRRGLVQHNRYFTGRFGVTGKGEGEKSTGSWLLVGLLGQQRINQEPSAMAPEQATTESKEKVAELRRNKSLSSLTVLTSISEGLTEEGGDDKSKSGPITKFQPRPSELREMNFMLPTSINRYNEFSKLQMILGWPSLRLPGTSMSP
uniref:Uncharacterized protein n=1 Tax=Timema genevievae TaxID=629358 RepID=A0A7R9PMU9_TIMGE|nr:unnamed protein product [Timema genevievae]